MWISACWAHNRNEFWASLAMIKYKFEISIVIGISRQWNHSDRIVPHFDRCCNFKLTVFFIQIFAFVRFHSECLESLLVIDVVIVGLEGIEIFGGLEQFLEQRIVFSNSLELEQEFKFCFVPTCPNQEFFRMAPKIIRIRIRIWPMF